MHKVQIFRGDTWMRRWELRTAGGTPTDITGATARLQVRDDSDSVVLSASTSDGRITVYGTQGRIDMVVPYAATESLAPGEYMYDLEVTFSYGTRRTIEQAVLAVAKDVTR